MTFRRRKSVISFLTFIQHLNLQSVACAAVPYLFDIEPENILEVLWERVESHKPAKAVTHVDKKDGIHGPCCQQVSPRHRLPLKIKTFCLSFKQPMVVFCCVVIFIRFGIVM